MYDVTEADRSKFIRIVNPRRGALKSTPLLSWHAWRKVSDELLSAFELGGYVGCVSAEMEKRPVPHVFREEKTRMATQLYEKRGPEVLERILSRIKPPVQPLNRESRLGFPFFRKPVSKRSTLLPWFARLEEQGADEMLAEAFIIMNVRLQPEPKSKVRNALFINDEGGVYEADITEKDRIVQLPRDMGKAIAARTRLVFNMPAANLYKQCLDTAINNVLMQQRAFHHNMFSSTGYLPMQGASLFFDVKHFERHTAAVARMRARIIGGMYGDIVRNFSRIPFLCPSDTWNKLFFLWPQRSLGWSDQFASGDSAVAPLQKELFTCIYMEVAEQILGIAPDASLDWVWAGGDERITIRNFGDDNALSGDPSALNECFALVREYVEAEVEVPPKFLGFVWTGKDGFRLAPSSYLLKTYLNERAPFTSFRPYPLYGWVEKRKVYSAYGMAEIPAEVFPAEDKLLLAAGHGWQEILRKAAAESLAAHSASGVYSTPNWILGKDWKLTAEEKLSTGLYEGLMPVETRRIIRNLLGPEWRGVVE